MQQLDTDKTREYNKNTLKAKCRKLHKALLILPPYKEAVNAIAEKQFLQLLFYFYIISFDRTLCNNFFC